MDDDSALIEPRRIPGDPHIDHPIILNLFEPYFEFLRKELKIKKSALKRLRFPSMTCCSTSIDGRKVSVFGTPLGAPQAAIVLERLIAMGARKILSFGCCGSLQPDLGVGSLVVPTDALCEEGTSAHYPLPEGTKGKADDQIVQLCLAKSRDRKFKAVSGRV
jgi:uridine phosphorylase